MSSVGRQTYHKHCRTIPFYVYQAHAETSRVGCQKGVQTFGTLEMCRGTAGSP
jgi:hypothetical protein